jgi:hypothetical protein
VHVSTLVAEVLDPVLTAGIFSAGQTGLGPEEAGTALEPAPGRWPQQSGTVIWCAPHEDVQQKYAALPQAGADGIGRDYGCVDLTVTISAGKIAGVDLEGYSLAETFSALGRDAEAGAAERLLGASAKSASAALAELLRTLFALAED